MQAWYLNENPYPFVPPDVLEAADSVRGSLPNKYCDPKLAADLFQEALDEYLLCDDLGINVVSNEQAMAKGLMFAGDPDSVYRQILEHRERVGPYEHLVLASRSGFMTHAEATKGLKLFSKEVLPRLREL